MGTTKTTNEDFVVAWAKAVTLEDVVRATDMKKAAVQQRAKFLRDKGVKLPKLEGKRGLDSYDIARLNSLIKKHNRDDRKV